MINIRQLVDEVRRLATESPDNVYPNEGEGCYYNSGTCTNGSVGCIFGQACKVLGLEPREHNAISCNIEDWERHEVLEIPAGDTPLIDWCVRVQANQDNEETWGEAVKLADINN